MPRDANGNYTLPPSYHVQTGDTLLPVQHNPPFEDVANALTNSVARDGRTVMTGDLQMGGNKITNVAAGTLDNDAATVSQIRSSSGVVRINDFGADPTGVEDSSEAILTAVLYANDNNLKVTGNGRFKLEGSDVIDITTDVDFSGAIFDCSEWTGFFNFTRKKVPVTYPSGSAVVNALKASTDLTANSARFSGWNSTPEVDDSYIIINTTQDFYSFRGAPRKRQELNRVFKDGIVASPLRYDLAAESIDSVQVFPMEDRWREAKGLTLDIRGADPVGEGRYVRVQTSLLDIDVRILQDRDPSVTSNYSYVEFDHCCAIKARLTMQWPNRSAAGYTYNFSINRGYEVEVEPYGDGDGWGAMGSNVSQRITIRGGQVNRIDFHQPVAEWFRVLGTTVGNWGILVTMVGDLIVEDTNFHIRRQANINNIGVIRSRGDSGGFCDGDLIMRNCKVTIDKGTSDLPGADGVVNLIQHQQDATGTAKPSGTPINYRFWRIIDVDGLQTFGAGTSARFQPLDLVNAGRAATIAICEEINVRNARGENLFFAYNLGDKTPSRSGAYPFKADFENITADTISIVSSTNAFRCSVGARNCRGAVLPGILMETHAPGDYVVEGGIIGMIDLYSGADPAGLVSLRYVGSTLYRIGGGYIQGDAGAHDVRLIDCSIHNDSITNLYTLITALLIRPKVYISDVETQFRITNDLNETPGNWTLLGNARAGQPVTAVFGAGADISEFAMHMPPVGRIVDGVARGSSGPLLAGFRRSGPTTLTAGTAGTSPRYLVIA